MDVTTHSLSRAAMLSWPMPSSGEVQEIVALEDPVLRNLRITVAYHDLTHALTRLFGDRNLTWCAFGCWASKTAGTFIRRDALPVFLTNLVDEAMPAVFNNALMAALRPLRSEAALPVREVVERILARSLDEVSSEIATGNLIVFDEIGLAFARLLEVTSGGAVMDPIRCERFLDEFRPGPPEAGGQELLRKGFARYLDAAQERDPKKRAELMLLANLLVGYQEQRRVQRHVAGSLCAPIDDVLVAEFEQGLRLVTPEPLQRRVSDLLEYVLRPMATTVRQVWCRFATRTMMRLTLPDVVLDLGMDIPPLSSRMSFPRPLRYVENPELTALLDDLDRSPDTLTGSAAHDWSNLRDRMHYIADLFRSRQQDASLLRPPFTDTQLRVIRTGEVPEGDL